MRGCILPNGAAVETNVFLACAGMNHRYGTKQSLTKRFPAHAGMDRRCCFYNGGNDKHNIPIVSFFIEKINFL